MDRVTGFRGAIAAAVAVVIGIWFGATAASAQAGVAAFRVGDAVRITVWNGPQYSGEFEIGEDGTVIHPLFQSIRIVGLTTAQAEEQIRSVLRRDLADPVFVIEPLFRIPVSGEVRAPNIYTLPPQATLMSALAAAGGTTEDADLQRIRVLREGRALIYDLREPGNEFAETRIRSGDQIIVDRRSSVWRDSILPVIQTAGSLSSIVYLFFQIRDWTD